MRDTRLVFVEGLTGSGKSTSAQWLCRLLESNGLPVTWYHELDMHHPVVRYNDVERTARSPEACDAFHAESRGRWNDFVAAATDGARVSIFDGSLLQVPLYSMLTAMCGGDAVTRHVDDVERIVSPLKPVLIFLGHADMVSAFDRTCALRPGFEQYVLEQVATTPYGRQNGVADRAGLLRLLLEQRALARRLMGTRRMDVLDIEVDEARWDDYRTTMAGFVGVPGGAQPPMVDLSGLPGRYLDAESNEMVVDVDGRGLFLQPSGTRLLARRADAFDIEGLSVELTFEREGDVAARILCAARVTDFGTVWVRQG